MEERSWEEYILNISKQPCKQAWIGIRPPFEKDVIDLLFIKDCTVDPKFLNKYQVVWLYEQLYETIERTVQKKILERALSLLKETGKIVILVRNNSFGQKEIEEVLEDNLQSYELENSFSYGWNGLQILVYNVVHKCNKPIEVEETFHHELKKKYAILVEPEFRNRHFSICSYITSIGRFLAETNEVEYITYRKTLTGLLWYRILIHDWEKEKTSKMNVPKMRIHTPSFEDIRIATAEKKTLENTDEYIYIGQNLFDERIDTCIISNPWIVDEHVIIPATHTIGVVYDLIANTYAISGREDLVDWAIGHHVGFHYYNNHCDKIIAISNKVMEQYLEFYPNADKNKLFAFPSIPPYPYKNVRLTGFENREKSIILAAPFERRKGLQKIPAILNSVIDKVDHVYIFGSTRCSEEDFKWFWQQLKSWTKIEYYPTISYDDLIKLYKKCKVLLFPSLEEGLGLPIIEAQMCGCVVATVDVSPMNTLISEEGYFLKGNLVDDSEALKQLLDKEIDTRKLSERTALKNTYERIADVI